MDRRFFAKLLALGAGSMPFLSLAARPDEQETPPENAADQPPRNAATNMPPPVTIADMTEIARRKLPKGTFDYITSGSEDEVTLRENIAAFRRLKIYTPILKGVQRPDLSTSVLGERIALPVLLAPASALSLFHRDGAQAAARAASKSGTIFAMSGTCGSSVEEVSSVTQGSLWFQLYVPKDRGITRRLIERVERSGAKAIVVTVDLGERKDQDRRNRFRLPKAMLLKILREDIGHKQLRNTIGDEELRAYNLDAWDISLSWDFIHWLRSVTKLPLLVKGIVTREDAIEAVNHGVEGIVVSNHGGRRLDGMPASIDVLEDIATAVNGRTEILLDSGVRRGTDVLKAIALGAKAVLIGRPYAWGLAADGQAGVELVLEMLRAELENAMIATGCANVDEITASLLNRR